jgi:glycosyltransferase involved in cell wall biosynthesis
VRVTVAICTWNRCELLRQTLEQLVRVDVPADTDLDLLVVNNNCTDATDAVVDAFRDRLPIRRVFEAEPGLSNARNAALAAASGEYVIFTDDDVLVSEAWLSEFRAATRAFPDAAAIGGVIEPWFPQPPDPELLAAFPPLRNGFCGLDHEREAGPLPEPLSVWGANMAYRTAAIASLRFDPDLGPSPTSTVCADETDFVRRLRARGESVVWWPRMRVRHYVEPSRMTLDYLLRFTEGKGTEQVLTGPNRPAPAWLGSPRWLWLTLVKTGCSYAWLVAGGGGRLERSYSGPLPARQASRTARALAYRREIAFVRGMIRGHRRMHLQPQSK